MRKSGRMSKIYFDDKGKRISIAGEFSLETMSTKS
jgi:hypothetical protein